MIFLTVGTQLPFDRLIKVVNDFSLLNPHMKIVGQVGKTELKGLNFESHETLSISQFDEFLNQADVIISHAGMGTILTALTAGKALFMMPRLFKYGEHRNDHQLGTLEKFIGKDFCYGFNSLGELEDAYNSFIKNKTDSISGTVITADAPKNMIDSLSSILTKCMDD